LRPRSNSVLKAAAAIALLAGAAGCTQTPSPGKPVARVGSSELTSADLARLGDSLGLPAGRDRSLIDAWVENEVLYQEAQRRGLTESDEVLARVEEAKKTFAIDALLSRELADKPGDQVTDDAVAAYLAANAPLFILREDVVKASYALFADREPANAFRTALVSGKQWDDALTAIRTDSSAAASLRSAAREQYFTQGTLYPDELWKLARTLGKDEVSFAVRTPAGYAVIVARGMKRAGESPDLAYVGADIRERILIERRRARYEQLLNSLRNKQRVEVTPAAADSVSGTSD
jgi:peptidyl-prolyl cis-trans isomerase C